MHGVFVRDQVTAASAHSELIVIADDGPQPVAGRLYTLRDGVEDGIRTIRVGYRRGPGQATVGYVQGVFAGVTRLLREGWRPDLLHAHVYYAGLVTALLKARYRVPSIVSEHSSHFLQGTLSRLDLLRARAAFRLADVVCPVSARLERAIADLGIRARFSVMPNTIDTAAFEPSPFAAGGPTRMLAVGGLAAVKDVPNLIAAAAVLKSRRSNFALDIVGDGEDRCKCEAMVRERGLADVVSFHGYLPRRAVAGLLQRCHFLVLPSAVETFGVVLLEALASGRPAVATDVGVAREVLGDGAGIVVPPSDSAALATALDQMMDRYQSYEPSVLASKVAARFGPAAIGQRWEELYRSVCERRMG
jgi:glycosyltransferase involved in cell wall biosynthesis